MPRATSNWVVVVSFRFLGRDSLDSETVGTQKAVTTARRPRGGPGIPLPAGTPRHDGAIVNDAGSPGTPYERMVGARAPGLRRVVVAALAGVIAGAVAWVFIGWQLGVLVGWDVGALSFVGSAWSVIVTCDGRETMQHAMRDDPTRTTAAGLLLGASLASLFSVGFTLSAAGRAQGSHRLLLITGALATVMLAWTVANTVFTLHYADIHYRLATGVDFGSADPAELPDYRDFAYLAFTIGMCYQVSDTTLRDRRLRRVVLGHSILSYVFGVVIIAAAINLTAGLIA